MLEQPNEGAHSFSRTINIDTIKSLFVYAIQYKVDHLDNGCNGNYPKRNI